MRCSTALQPHLEWLIEVTAWQSVCHHRDWGITHVSESLRVIETLLERSPEREAGCTVCFLADFGVFGVFGDFKVVVFVGEMSLSNAWLATLLAFLLF